MSVYSRSTAVRTMPTRSRTVKMRRCGWKLKPSCSSVDIGEKSLIHDGGTEFTEKANANNKGRKGTRRKVIAGGKPACRSALCTVVSSVVSFAFLRVLRASVVKWPHRKNRFTIHITKLSTMLRMMQVVMGKKNAAFLLR